MSLLNFIAAALFITGSPNSVLVCNKPELAGLYKQCEEGLAMQNLGRQVRVYFKSRKVVETVSIQQVFEVSVPNSSAKLSPHQMVSVAGKFLWNNSPDGFQSLCRINEVKKANFVTISCGRHKEETVKREHLYVLKEFNTPTSSLDAIPVESLPPAN